jgi:hypothetical protein
VDTSAVSQHPPPSSRSVESSSTSLLAHKPAAPPVYSRPIENFQKSINIGPANGIHVPSPPSAIHSLQPPPNLTSYIRPHPVYRSPQPLIPNPSRSNSLNNPAIQYPVYRSANTPVHSQDVRSTNLAVHNQSCLVPQSQVVHHEQYDVPIRHAVHPGFHGRSHSGPPPYATATPTNPGGFPERNNPIDLTCHDASHPPAPPVQEKALLPSPAEESDDDVSIVSSAEDEQSESGEHENQGDDDEISVSKSLS